MEKICKESVEFVIIHHSNRTLDCPVFIRLRHRFLRGWEDTGYHFIIGNGIFSKDGEVYGGRSLEFVGAHAYGYNKKSIGICLIGDFDKHPPSFRQYRALIKLISSLKEEYPGIIILGHSETQGCFKTCPGTLFNLKKLRTLL